MIDKAEVVGANAKQNVPSESTGIRQIITRVKQSHAVRRRQSSCSLHECVAECVVHVTLQPRHRRAGVHDYPAAPGGVHLKARLGNRKQPASDADSRHAEIIEIGEGGGIELSRKRQRATAKPEQTGRADEQALVIVAAADGYVSHRSRADSDSLRHEIPNGERRVRSRRSRLEDWVGLLVAIGARRALNPADVRAGIEHHVSLTRRLTDSDSGEVLAASLTRSGDNRTLHFLCPKFELIAYIIWAKI
ncbi:glycine-rich cell wall structural protein 1-like [Senna tora]|uniref:Glycine-rich cell wall structural protein 1-like n=1 Tax=Senna tora TaxID=362788 RepID=A0A834W466_9FABA|nr:glycine-rich cell wall structural protein 1-like [Senna tora]